MNYEEMSDFEISKRIAEIVYGATDVMELVYARNKSSAVWQCPVDGLKSFDINNPSDAWSIIESIWDELMSPPYRNHGTKWERFMLDYDCGKLRAAMICFLKMKDS